VGSLKEDTTVVVVSYSGKEINAKLVYYGAGLSGKTTNLEAIYEAVPDTSRGKMVSMKTQSDRTLFFDLLPLDLGEIMGFKTRFLLYTVPGQVFYNATRKLVLKGADAIVFVADSEVGKMEENRESLQNLRDNLAEYKLSLDDIPWVIQYNKRDLPNVYTIEELNKELLPGGKVPHFEAVATQGKGVFETFRGISHLLMEKVTKDLRRGPSSTTGSAREAAKHDDSTRAASTPAAVVAPPAPAAPTPAPVASTPARLPSEPQVAASNAPTDGGVDYGRQIELPDETLVASARPAAAPAPAPAPARAAPMPTVSQETVAAVAPAGLRAAAERAGANLAAPSIQTASPAGSGEAADPSSSASVVVPITFPINGQTGEIVIRIVLKPAA
jgi:signal recognition particle receptor subunit beta